MRLNTMIKPYQQFESNLRQLQQHVQLLDLSLKATQKMCSKKNNILPGKKIAEIMGANTETHIQLNIPNTRFHINRVYAYSRFKLNEQAMIDLYRIFADFMSGILASLSNKEPNKLLGILAELGTRSIDYSRIVKLKTYNAILKEMASTVFRGLEAHKNTNALLKKIISLTKLNISQELQNDALLYLEIRHLIIHNKGRTDEKFLVYPGAASIPQTNGKIKMTFDLVLAATEKVSALCKAINEELIRKGILDSVHSATCNSLQQ